VRRLSAIVLIIVAFMVSGCQSHSTRSAPEVGRASTPEPTLGKSWGFFAQEGYGTVRPRTIFNGGDPTGQVTAVHWRSWGDQTAVGEGSGVWVPPSNDPSVGVGSDSEDVPAVVVAFRLGWCGKTYMYRAVEWYFPSKGEKFDALHYIDICNGRYVPSP
jgi:hypothetical protein